MQNNEMSAGTNAGKSTTADVLNVSQLKVGDVIYGKNRMYGICRKVVVERLTRTQAICGGLKFKIDVNNGAVKAIGETYDSWNVTYYYLENDKLKEEYFRQNACAQLKSFDYGSLSTETLNQLVSILDQNIKS